MAFKIRFITLKIMYISLKELFMTLKIWFFTLKIIHISLKELFMALKIWFFTLKIMYISLKELFMAFKIGFVNFKSMNSVLKELFIFKNFAWNATRQTESMTYKRCVILLSDSPNTKKWIDHDKKSWTLNVSLYSSWISFPSSLLSQNFRNAGFSAEIYIHFELQCYGTIL